MTNPPKEKETTSEASKLEEKPDLKLVRALQKDFKALYSPQYTANHKAKQMLINLEISIMRLDNIESLINKQRQEARVRERQEARVRASLEALQDFKRYMDLTSQHAFEATYSVLCKRIGDIEYELKELESKEEASE